MEEKPANTPSKPGPKRRWFQYSLRTLLILTTMVGALFAWWSYKARQQRATVATLKTLGAEFTYDFEGTFQDPPTTRRIWPGWLVESLGVDYFASVSQVIMPSRTTDVDSALLANLTGLTRLELNGTEITDAGLQYLQPLGNLRYLRLQNTQITDRGLQSVKHLVQLEVLLLGNTQVTSAGIERLQKALPNCKIYR